MTTTHATRTGAMGGGFHLQYMAMPDSAAGPAPAVTSFTASLASVDGTELDLAGISGLVVDAAKLETDGPACITVHDALIRHTPPKRISLAQGAAARLDLHAGTDGRIACDTRFALFLWLPEIYNESRRGVGTLLLHTLQDFLSFEDHASVLVDFGVPDEQDGFLRVFYPKLGGLNLTLSQDGQFARGPWVNGSCEKRKTRDIGVVYL